MKSQLALWKQLVAILVLAAIGYGAWQQRETISKVTGLSFGKEGGQGRRSGRGGRGETAVPVIVEPVNMAQAVDKLQAIGTGRANQSVTIYPEVTGTVAAIDFEAGKQVDKGEVLLMLDDTEAQIAVEIAEAKMAEAKRTLERSQTLLKRKAIPEATVQTAQTTLRTAELELKQAREALADRTVRAPFAGVVGIPQVETGDRITEQSAITSLDDRSVIVIAFDLPEIYLNALKPGHKVVATTPGLRGREFEGKITQINSRIDPVTRAVRIRAELANSEDLLRGGMSFIVNLTLEGKTYPSVAELALIWERDGSYVWRVSKGKAEQIKVGVVKRAAGRVLVDGDLAEGQLIVVEGTQRLRPGRQVSFEQPESTARKEAGL